MKRSKKKKLKKIETPKIEKKKELPVYFIQPDNGFIGVRIDWST